MDDEDFSVIKRRWKGDNERLGAYSLKEILPSV